MTNGTSAETLAADLRELANRNGWTQSEMASLLGISQGHLSKVLRGRHRPAPRLRHAAAGLGRCGEAAPEAWLRDVSEAAKASPDFRAAIDAMLRVMRLHAYGKGSDEGGGAHRT